MGFLSSLAGPVGAIAGSFLGGPTGASIGYGLGNMIGGGNQSAGYNPANLASPHLEKIPELGRKYYDPYINQGQNADQAMHNIISSQNNLYETPTAYKQMAENPNDFVNAILKNYNPSTGYKYKEKKLLDTARNSAAAGGFSGTPYDQQQQAELVNGLLGTDMQEFLQNVLGVQGQGLQGEERRLGGRERALDRLLGYKGRLSERGYESSGNLADYLAQAANAQSGLAYNSQQYNNRQSQARNNANQMNMQNILGGALGLMGNKGPGFNGFMAR